MSKREHDFKEIQRTDTPIGKKDWHCKKCDSIVRYDARLTRTDVNQLIRRTKFLCIPPLPEVQVIARNFKPKSSMDIKITDKSKGN